jgi:hypothetical protein
MIYDFIAGSVSMKGVLAKGCDPWAPYGESEGLRVSQSQHSWGRIGSNGKREAGTKKGQEPNSDGSGSSPLLFTDEASVLRWQRYGITVLGKTEDERRCRVVLICAANDLGDSPKAQALLQRLEAELHCLEQEGKLKLRPCAARMRAGESSRPIRLENRS